MKKIKVHIVNSSTTEAFGASGLVIERNHDEKRDMTMEEANKLVASLSGIAAVSVSFISEGEDSPLSGLDVAVAAANEALQAELASLKSELGDQVAALQATVEARDLTIVELEAVINKAATLEPVTAAEAETVKTAETKKKAAK
jgi:hypothetical protein